MSPKRSSPDPESALPDVTSTFRGALARSHGALSPPDVQLQGDSAEAMASARVDALRGEGDGHSKRYVLEGEIGRGGMGAVLEIFDADLRRRLAMKVALLPEGGADDATHIGSTQLLRFLEEAQVTGQLDHPGVVPVHELGVDADGRVYFTMRLVRGQELTKVFEAVHTGDGGWNRTRALGALLKVCEAMSYAHEKGVVHRDLKPANVMVGRHGEVYVMDWGLARVAGRAEAHDVRPRPTDVSLSRVQTDRRDTGERSDDSPILTMDGSVLGTPFFMPPEQAAGRLDEIGPRSDVYALGAMLYMLLTGRMPYHRPGDRASPHTILAMVMHGPPEAVHRLKPDVPPELESICEKAMARAPGDRYADMGELAEDLRAYLEDRVVRAHRTGAVVELRKWVRRNRALAVSLSALVLLVVGGATTAAVVLGAKNAEVRQARDQALEARDVADAAARRESAQRVVAEETRAESESVTEFLVGQFESLEPEERRGQPLSVLEFLDRAAASLDGTFTTDSRAAAELRAVVGNAYQSLGHYGAAERLLERALVAHRASSGEDDPQTLTVANDLAVLYEHLGRFAESERLHDEVLRRRRATLGEDHADTLATLADLAFLYESMGRIEDAERLYESTLAGRRAVLGSEHADTLTSMGDLALLYESLDRFDEAEPLLTEALETSRRVLGGDHPDTLTAGNNLALLLASQGRAGRSEALFQEVIVASEQVLGRDHPDTLATLNNLALLYDDEGRRGEAEALYLEVLAGSRARLGHDHPDTLITLQHIVEFHLADRRWEVALPYARELVERTHADAEELPERRELLQRLEQRTNP